jgi:hypothetical protein
LRSIGISSSLKFGDICPRIHQVLGSYL